MTRVYAMLVAFLTPLIHIFYPYRLSGKVELPEGAAVICANHSSNIDPVIVAMVLGKNNYTRFMAKAPLFKIPIAGAILRKIEAIAADRDGKDVNALRLSMQALKEGHRLMLFPEGTRAGSDGDKEAKTGAVRMASKFNAPIIPIFISREKKIFRKYDVCVGQPYSVGKIPRDGYEQAAEELMEKIASLNPEVKRLP